MTAGFTAAYAVRLAAWGLVAAALSGGVVQVSWERWEKVLRGANAEARHRVACGHFFAVLVLPGAAVVGVQAALAAMGTEISREPPAVWGVFGGESPGIEWLVVAGWLAGAVVASVRLAAGLWRLRRRGGGSAPESFTAEVRGLGARAGARGRLRVRVADVPVPQVTGIVRPVLTVPAGFPHLPAAEREAVLLHELAHVARRDFAANLLQRFVLASLWFQPAAWALYRRVAREREARCDQFAVRQGASAPALARALVRLAEGRRLPVALAAASREDLGWRVRRLLAPTTGTPTPRRWPAMLSACAAVGLCGLAGTRLAVADRTLTDFYIASALGPVVAVDARDPGGAFGLRIHRGRVLAATVEHRVLPAASIRQHGDRVTLLGATREPVVSLRVTPFGRVEWRARLAGTPEG